MAQVLTRVLALGQVPLAPTALSAFESASALATGTSTQASTVDTAAATCQTDRPDPYVCECLGLNGCWAPSEPGTGGPYTHDGNWPKRSKKCKVEACRDPNGDDAPAILRAFDECKEDGHIIFENTTYYIGTVMNTTGLKDVDVEVKGTLLWNTDIDYWLANSLPIGFQNQTSAWHLGGENLHFYGHGYGTLNGNGQAWYDFNQGMSNRHGRPHALLITGTKNSVVEGLRFIKSQMWTMTVARSEKMLLQDIYVNNTSDNENSNVNTDGVDTVYANNITFLRWTVDNGDDSISMKQNSTNIYIADCDFYNGQSLAMGSIGQYPGQIEVIENVVAENIRCTNTGYGGRVKTWTGVQKGYPPNGGGGGLGYARNITFRDFQLTDVNLAWALFQCTSYSGQTGDCDTSKFQITDMNWGNARGTLKGDRVATLQCSGAAPCTDINLYDNDLQALDQNIPATSYLCDNVDDPQGFECTGPCNGQCGG
ncbi:hypothetical protein PRZ48_010474 [Zasmidium cellare]|uniref:Glycoside hydrolase family 28 protein n=1 Tax=Zasmidium cellare TaxID=395010 RepID=A0ABR0E8W8_ZASCE|nr:hypothetical protein PRZ48_010474 [Zasmidium cellare]